MEAKNLRLHNWVLCNGLRTTVNIPLLKAVFENNIQETVEPLPLTEEWLNKFGFVEESENDFTLRQSPMVFTIHRNLITKQFMCRMEINYSFLVETVHELQNLFFAITKQELEIKQDVSACS